jgi:hypothetical protein
MTFLQIFRFTVCINCSSILYVLHALPTISSLVVMVVAIMVIKVKLSRYRPGQALGVPGNWSYRISRQSVHEGGKVVSHTHRPSLPPGRIPLIHFCQRLSRPQGHNATGRIKSLKNVMMILMKIIIMRSTVHAASSHKSVTRRTTNWIASNNFKLLYKEVRNKEFLT